MKKALSIVLVVLLTVMLAVPMFAAYKENATQDISIDVQKATTAFKPDGVISSGEYYEIALDKSWFSYAVNDADTDALYERVEGRDYKLYMSWDDTHVNYALTVPVDDSFYYCPTADPTAIWNYTACQIGIADKEAIGNEFLEIGMGRNEESGDNVSTIWAASLYADKDFVFEHGKNYNVAYANGVLTYEVSVPFNTFTEGDLKLGDTFLTTAVYALGDDATMHAHAQIGYGITGDPGKKAEGFMTAKLVAAPAAPAVVEEPVADVPAEKDGVEETPTAPVSAPAAPVAAPETSDAALIILSTVSAISACGVAVFKKRK